MREVSRWCLRTQLRGPQLSLGGHTEEGSWGARTPEPPCGREQEGSGEEQGDEHLEQLLEALGSLHPHFLPR